MAETLIPRGAVTADLTARGVHLSEIRDLGKIDLRGDPSDRRFMGAVGRALDLLLPTEPCSSTGQGQVTVLWLGPDQWLITCPRGEVAAMIDELAQSLETSHAAVTDVSAGRVTFRLAGPNAIDVVAKGCSLDLDPRVVKSGFVAASVFAKINALVHLAEPGSVDLHIGRSFADYLWAWLEDAGLEYGVVIDPAPRR